MLSRWLLKMQVGINGIQQRSLTQSISHCRAKNTGFLCAFFVTTICLLYLHITRPDIPGHHSSCNHSETLHCTFCLSMCWTSTGISGSAKYVIAEKCLDISVIHWSQCRSGGYYSSESFGDKGHHTSIPKPGLLVLLTEQLAFKLWYAPECTSLLSLW